ncbi:MAG: GspH/FimT family pseudopilin [Desulfobacterales bacterium]
MRRDAGFSAFEVAVTLAVVALLASVSMPSFLRWLQVHRLRGAAINLTADLEMAKVRAIREGATVSVVFTESEYTLFLDNGAGGGAAGDGIRNGAEALVQYRRLPPGVRIDPARTTLPDHRLRFNSRGLAPDLSAAEVLCLVNGTGERRIRVNRLGNIRTL